MNSLETAIITTLAYSNYFNFPLTSTEIYKRLASDKVYLKPQFDATLESLHLQGYIKQSGSYYYLSGNQTNLVKSRESRLEISKSKIAYAKTIASQIIKIPSVESVFLTGALSVHNASSNDDIDFMIITKPNRLWTTRLLITCWLDWLHIRRKPDDLIVKDKICPNLYLSADCLSVPKQIRNIYTAYEVIQAQFLAGNQAYSQLFLDANAWIADYLGNFADSSLSNHLNDSIALPTSPGLIERIFYHLQTLYMKRKRTRELVHLQYAFFHPIDHSKTILSTLKRQKYDH